MNSRRDLLKLFGIGAVAVPLIKGYPATETRDVAVIAPPVDVPPEQDVPVGVGTGCRFYINDRLIGDISDAQVSVSLYAHNRIEATIIPANTDAMDSIFNLFTSLATARFRIELPSEKDTYEYFGVITRLAPQSRVGRKARCKMSIRIVDGLMMISPRPDLAGLLASA